MTELLVFLAGVTVGISLTAMMYVFWVIPKARKVFMEIVEVAERQKAGHTYRDTEGHYVYRGADGVEQRIDGR